MSKYITYLIVMFLSFLAGIILTYGIYQTQYHLTNEECLTDTQSQEQQKKSGNREEELETMPSKDEENSEIEKSSDNLSRP